MALRTVAGSQGQKVYSNKMAVGETVEGYYTGMVKGQYGDVLHFQKKDGSRVEVLTSGNLRYLRDDGEKDPTKKLQVGQFTVITKTAAYRSKNGKDTSKFTVQQDDENVNPELVACTANASAAQATTTDTTMATINERLNNAKAKKTA